MEIVNLRYKLGKDIVGGGYEKPPKMPWLITFLLIVIMVLLVLISEERLHGKTEGTTGKETSQTP